MKALAQRIWLEPAAFLGLVVTLALVAVNLIGDDSWDVQTIIEVIAPLLTALGIRQAVIPVAKLDDLTAPTDTTYQRAPSA